MEHKKQLQLQQQWTVWQIFNLKSRAQSHLWMANRVKKMGELIDRARIFFFFQLANPVPNKVHEWTEIWYEMK